ncbi:MAG TPA: polymer-forming cytoskeletal protein [Candidatus Limnocylindria bacterium]|nr:polymer-forming cytoskeletal protein [Candidatus Limnocylindria bacterium]
MWGFRKDKRRANRLGAFLDEGSEIQGTYTCSGTVMLDARFRGELRAADTLVVGVQSVVEATVTATAVIVHGAVVGSIAASERIELRKTARVTGDIQAPCIVMEEGAVHDGHCRMTVAEPVEETRPVVVPLTA